MQNYYQKYQFYSNNLKITRFLKILKEKSEENIKIQLPRWLQIQIFFPANFALVLVSLFVNIEIFIQFGV
jgi:hypothetical protein